MKLGVVILTYMNYQDTFDCVNKLIEPMASYHSNSLILYIALIDNASPNEAGDHLFAYKNNLQTPSWVNVEFFRTSLNQGYGYGNNIGLEYLFNKQNCDVVFVMNNDIIVLNLDMNKLLFELTNKKGDVWGARIINRKSNEIEFYGGAVFSYSLFSSRRLLTIDDLAQNIEDEGLYISGAFIGFSRATYKIVGPFCEDFFLYFEEIEWFFRAHRKFDRKLNIVILEGIVLSHQIGGSTGNAEFGFQKSNIAEYYSARSRIIFARKVAPYYLLNAIFFNLVLAIHRLMKGYFRNVIVILIATYRGILGEKGYKNLA